MKAKKREGQREVWKRGRGGGVIRVGLTISDGHSVDHLQVDHHVSFACVFETSTSKATRGKQKQTAK